MHWVLIQNSGSVTPMRRIIGAEGLTKILPPSTKAVDGVSFSVGEGEVFGFLGPNGAGKTTTMRILCTLASVSEGTATVAGYDVKSEPAQVRRNIGVVPQEITLDNELKGIENLMLSAKLQHVPKKEALERASQLLGLVELDGAAGRRVRTYSGGMKRRLQLITALIHRPRIIFLDEPTSGLDVQTRTKIREYLRHLNRDRLTIFMTTHYLEEADQLSHRVAIMDYGTIKVSGTPSELKGRLHGDILTLEFAGSVADLSGLLGDIDNVAEVTRSGSTYRLKLPRVETALTGIVEGVKAKGLKIKQMSLTKPTMDQVFPSHGQVDEGCGRAPEQRRNLWGRHGGGEEEVISEGFVPGGDVVVHGDLTVHGSADLNATVRVDGAVKCEDLDVGGDFQSKSLTSNRARVGGHMTIEGALEASRLTSEVT